MFTAARIRYRRLPIICCCVALILTTLGLHQYTRAQRYYFHQSEVIKFFNLLPDRFINHHEYSFLLSTSVCAKDKYNIVMVVHSSPLNYPRRKLLRETYGSIKHYRGKRLTMVFMLGAVMEESLQMKLKKESEEFGDIVQGNFLDSYKNITMKHIMAMHWFKDNCKADYIMKLDDDTFVNPYRLVEFLSTVNDSNAIYCKLFPEDIPNRRPKSKWFTPVYQYPFEFFPPYCLGFAYITAPDAWKTLYRMSTFYRTMDMDDVYVTGVLASIGGVKRKDITDLMYDCKEHLDNFDGESFSKAVIFLDPLGECKDEAFKHWKDVM